MQLMRSSFRVWWIGCCILVLGCGTTVEEPDAVAIYQAVLTQFHGAYGGRHFLGANTISVDLKREDVIEYVDRFSDDLLRELSTNVAIARVCDWRAGERCEPGDKSWVLSFSRVRRVGLSTYAVYLMSAFPPSPMMGAQGTLREYRVGFDRGKPVVKNTRVVMQRG